MAEHDEAVVEVRHVGGVLVVRLLRPDPTSWYAHKLRTALFGFAEVGSALRVALDLREVEHDCTSTFGIFVTLDRKLRANAGALRLCCVSPAVRELLAATKLDRVFSVYSDVEHATADWSGR